MLVTKVPALGCWAEVGLKQSAANTTNNKDQRGKATEALLVVLAHVLGLVLFCLLSSSPSLLLFILVIEIGWCVGSPAIHEHLKMVDSSLLMVSRSLTVSASSLVVTYGSAFHTGCGGFGLQSTWRGFGSHTQYHSLSFQSSWNSFTPGVFKKTLPRRSIHLQENSFTFQLPASLPFFLHRPDLETWSFFVEQSGLRFPS